MVVPDKVYERLFKAIEARQDEFVERLREAVAIPSVPGDPDRKADCEKMTLWTKTQLENLGAKTELVYPEVKHPGSVVKPHPLVFGTLGEDKTKKTLLIYGLLDVQPAKLEDGWNTHPFELTEKDGKLYGSGSTDDKGPVVAWINMISAMQKESIEIPVNLKFCFECMEESGSVGLEEELNKRKEIFISDVHFAVISDKYPSKPDSTYGLRGISNFNFEISSAIGWSEGFKDWMWIVSKLGEPTASVRIPEIPETVMLLTKEEEKKNKDISMDAETIKKQDGVIGLTNVKEKVLMRRWRYPNLSIHNVGREIYSPSQTANAPRKFSMRLVPNMDKDVVDRLVKEYLEKELWPQSMSENKLTVKSAESAFGHFDSDTNENFQSGVRAIKRVFGVDPDFEGSIPITLAIEKMTGYPVVLLPIGALDDMAHSQNEKINFSNFVQGMKTLGAYVLELGSV